MKCVLLLVSLLTFSPLAFANMVDLNTAPAAQIASLPQMGTEKAQAIVDYRMYRGCFRTVNDLLKVAGISRADVDAIKGMVILSNCPSGSQPGSSKAQT